MEARKRKNKESSKHHYNVTFQDGASKSRKKGSLLSKFFLVILFLACIILVNAFWPAPEFSNEVKQWKDTGLYFRYNNKHEIFYHDIRSPDYDPASDPVLIAIHGFPTSGYDWRKMLPGFRKYFRRVIIPDLLGLGFSSKPFPYRYTISEHADIIADLLASLSINEVHAIVHDIGDNIAQEMLSRQQDNSIETKVFIKSLCLSDGPVLSSLYKPQPLQRLSLVPYFETIIPILMNRYLFMARFSAVTGVQLSKDCLMDVYTILLYKNGHRAATYVLNYIPEIRTNSAKWEKALEETDIPVHLIFGPRDPTSDYGNFLKTYKQRFPHSSVTYIETAGHFIHMEEPEKFVDGFKEYVERIGLAH